VRLIGACAWPSDRVAATTSPGVITMPRLWWQQLATCLRHAGSTLAHPAEVRRVPVTPPSVEEEQPERLRSERHHVAVEIQQHRVITFQPGLVAHMAAVVAAHHRPVEFCWPGRTEMTAPGNTTPTSTRQRHLARPAAPHRPGPRHRPRNHPSRHHPDPLRLDMTPEEPKALATSPTKSIRHAPHSIGDSLLRCNGTCSDRCSLLTGLAYLQGEPTHHPRRRQGRARHPARSPAWAGVPPRTSDRITMRSGAARIFGCSGRGRRG
jgi:hypothetical protein